MQTPKVQKRIEYKEIWVFMSQFHSINVQEFYWDYLFIKAMCTNPQQPDLIFLKPNHC